jgi:signal transduction histidine kinase
LNNLGIIYELQGDFKTALEYYLESLKIDEEIAPPISIADSYTNIGVLLVKLGNLQKAKQYYFKAYRIYKDTTDFSRIGLALNNLFEVYSKAGKNDSARYYIDNAIKVYQSHQIKQGLHRALLNKALFLANLEQQDSAYHYFQMSLEISRKINNAAGIGSALINISSIENQKENPEKALQLAEEALSIIREAGDVSLLAEAHGVLSAAYIKTGKIDLAFEHLSEFVRFKDSINTIDTKSIIAELEYKYETDAIEEENRFLKTENELKEKLIQTQKTRQWIIIIAFVILLFFVLILFNITRKLKKANTDLHNSNWEKEVQRKQLENLNRTKDKLFSIIGHDLRSPVANIKSFMDVILEDSEQFSKESIIEILNTARDSSSRTLLTLENLLAWARTQQGVFKVKKTELNLYELVEETFELVQSIAVNKKIDLLNETPKDCMAYADKDMLNVIIRNILSNALKFTEAPGYVIVKTKDHKNTKVLVAIEDTGVGMVQEELEQIFNSNSIISKSGTQNEKGSGIGLHLCREFIKEQKEEIWVESKKGEGTTFYFTVSKSL